MLVRVCKQVVEECLKPLDIEEGTLLLPQLLIVRIEATSITRVRPLFCAPPTPPSKSEDDKDRGATDARAGGWGGVDGWDAADPASAPNAKHAEVTSSQQHLDPNNNAALRVPSRQRIRSRASGLRSRASATQQEYAASEQERDELQAVRRGDRAVLLARVAELLKLELDPSWTTASPTDSTGDQTAPDAAAAVGTGDQQSESEPKELAFRAKNERMERATPALLMEHTHDIDGAFFHAIEHLARLGVRGLLVGEFHAEPPVAKTAGVALCSVYREHRLKQYRK